MKAIRLSRKIHKWFALLTGIQLVLWAVSGFYMVVVDIDTIHGDMLVKTGAAPVEPEALHSLSIKQIVASSPSASKITIKALMGRPVYVVHNGATATLHDAVTGSRLSPIDRSGAEDIAKYHYAGNGSVAGVSLIESDPPGEIKFLPLPVWRVDFDDSWGSSFYIDPQTGHFTSRRHTLWRVFDFLWMLHIMDYDAREDINNTVLRVFSLAGVALALSGLWLLFYSFRKKTIGEDTP